MYRFISRMHAVSSCLPAWQNLLFPLCSFIYY
jgi:hypothetical protein